MYSGQQGQPTQGFQNQFPRQDQQTGQQFGQQGVQGQFPQGHQQGQTQLGQQYGQQQDQQGQLQSLANVLLPEGITSSNIMWQGFATLGNSLNIPLSGDLVFSRLQRQQAGQQGQQGQQTGQQSGQQTGQQSGQQSGQQEQQGQLTGQQQGQQAGQQGLQGQFPQQQQKRQAELQGQQAGQQGLQGQLTGQQQGQQAGQQGLQGQQTGQQVGQQSEQQSSQGMESVDSILYLRVQTSLPAPFVIDTWLLTNQEFIDIYINRDNNCTLLRLPVQDSQCGEWKPINAQTQSQSQPMTSQVAQGSQMGSQQQQGMNMNFFQKDCVFGQQTLSFIVGSDQNSQLISLQVMSNVNNQMSPIVSLSAVRQQGAPQASDLQLPNQCMQPSNTSSGISSLDIIQRYMSVLLGQ